MKSIESLYEKIMKHLLARRKQEPDLYFSSRISNRDKHLDKGYWLIRNDQYLQVSFRMGRDGKEKIYNVASSVREEGTC